jgi:hypothetical protein
VLFSKGWASRNKDVERELSSLLIRKTLCNNILENVQEGVSKFIGSLLQNIVDAV